MTDRGPWWKGRRGEWLVVLQIVLMLLVFLGPRTVGGRPAWPFPFPRACSALGIALMVSGGVFLGAAIFRIGRGLTPLPYPRDNAELVQTGPYALVRHPMYAGGILAGLGFALIVRSWLTVGYVAALFVFVDIKSRREEMWLSSRYPAYETYRRRVRKLIPLLY